MAKNSFLLVNLKEDQTKKLAQVINNDSCRSILDYLADNTSTESDISKNLNLPMSTVHYNLQALIKVGLIEAEEFHYSEKGREVLHYKLANKYIIIAPKSTYGIKEKLRAILPVAAIVGAFAFTVQFFRNNFFARSFLTTGADMSAASLTASEAAKATMNEVARESAEKVVDVAASTGVEAVVDSAASTAGSVANAASGAGAQAISALPNVTTTTLSSATSTTSTIPTATTEAVRTIVQVQEPNIALWIIIGAVIALIGYLLVDYFYISKKY
ncbi:MAG: winged helix-turn-helix domain-containing protein [Candidatus Woesearchaeota archaeon]